MSKQPWGGPMFPVAGHLAERYKAALAHATGLNVSREQFSIDRMGWSPQLAAVLGEGYLQAGALRYAIILSPDQQEAPLVWRRFSYEAPLIEKVYNESRGTLLNLIEHEAIVVEMDNGLTVCDTPPDVLGIKRAVVHIETSKGTLGSTRQLLTMAEGMTSQARILDDGYIDQMLTLVAEVGDARRRPLPPEMVLGTTSLWADVGGVVYVLRPPADRSGDTIVIASRPDAALARMPVVTLELDEPRVVDVLHEKGYLRFGNEDKLLPRRLADLEQEAILAADLDLPSDEQARRRLISRSSLVRGGLTPLYFELDAERKRLESGAAFEPQHLSPEARWALSTPERDTDIMVNLISRFVRYDERLALHHRRRSIEREWPRFSEAKRRYLRGLFAYLEEGFIR